MITTFGNGDTILRSIILLILSAGVSFFIIFSTIVLLFLPEKQMGIP